MKGETQRRNEGKEGRKRIERRKERYRVGS
jgi:hypothetical protein